MIRNIFNPHFYYYCKYLFQKNWKQCFLKNKPNIFQFVRWLHIVKQEWYRQWSLPWSRMDSLLRGWTFYFVTMWTYSKARMVPTMKPPLKPDGQSTSWPCELQSTIHITATNNDNNNNHFSLTLPCLFVLCSCNSRASSPSTGSTAIYVLSIFTCTTWAGKWRPTTTACTTTKTCDSAPSSIVLRRMLASSVSNTSSPRSFSILCLMRKRNCGTPMTTKSRVGFSSCREFPKQSREKNLKRYKCLAFELAQFLHESWKKSSSVVAESSQTSLQSMITELELKLSFSISLFLWESKFGIWLIYVLLL